MTSLNCSQNAAKHYTFSAWTAPPIVLHPPALHSFRCGHPSTVGNLDFTDLAYFPCNHLDLPFADFLGETPQKTPLKSLPSALWKSSLDPCYVPSVPRLQQSWRLKDQTFASKVWANLGSLSISTNACLAWFTLVND